HERLEQEAELLAGGTRSLARRQQLGEDAAELRDRGMAQSPVARQIAETRAERIGPGPERQDLLRLMAGAEGDAQTPPRRLLAELLQQPCLADSGLAGDQDDAAAEVEHRVEGGTQPLRFRGAP